MTERGDRDLFLARPDGSRLRNITNTPELSEFGGRYSPDGKRLCGTANVAGQQWNIVAIDIATGEATLLSRKLNCTPDWFQQDPNRVIYSHRSPGLATKHGWTMLMQATADGKSRNVVYAEAGQHIYFGCTSPDDKYVIFPSQLALIMSTPVDYIISDGGGIH